MIYSSFLITFKNGFYSYLWSEDNINPLALESTQLSPTELLESAINDHKGLALYRLPREQEIKHIIGYVSDRIVNDKKGFLIQPYDSSKPFLLISDHRRNKVSRAKKKDVVPQESTSKDKFLASVKELKDLVVYANPQKTVLARVESIVKPETFDTITFFLKLCNSYPSSFISLTYLPNTGLWIGASPEVLITQQQDKITVYSLAGTKSIDDETPWAEKEIEEQQIVTDTILQKLVTAKLPALHLSSTETIVVGKLKHRLSVFSTTTMSRNKWMTLAKKLHPTPAVKGNIGREDALKLGFREGFDRRFYAGYLGPVNWEGNSHLYVNLRCVEVTDKQLTFYAGAGITKDSMPEREWEETEAKMNVLRDLL
jgi:isochorismate synthase